MEHVNVLLLIVVTLVQIVNTYLLCFLCCIKIFLFRTDLGCLAGGLNACLKSGTCSGTGVCQCVNGFIGSICSLFYGCALGGSFACANGGVCNTNTGICPCPFSYGRSKCTNYLGCSAGGSLSCMNGGTSNSGNCTSPIGYSRRTCLTCRFIFSNFINFS